MQRRDFIINTALSAIAVSATGFIRFNGKQYVGDCETTTDILGPYYRPDSPLRSNLIVKGEEGIPVELSGIICHKDCISPYKNAKIELWHCSSKGVYDNTSAAYKNRGTVYTDDKGRYSFKTVLPVPYDIGNGKFRPAHFHMMISAAGYQPLITQLYFSGDVHIAEDDSASAPAAKKRILEVQNMQDGTKKVIYNVGMSEKLAASPDSIDKLIGIYTDEKDPKEKTEFFKKDNLLWLKNEVYGMNFEYTGDNTFIYPGLAKGSISLHFDILPSGAIKLTNKYTNEKGEEQTMISKKEK